MIKQRDKEIFLSLLSSVVSGNSDICVPGDTDFKALYLISCAHRVTGTLYFALRDYVPANEIEKKICALFKAYCNTVRKNLVIQEYYTELACNLCREKKIKFALLKGAFIKKLYPDAAMRSSCDVDILVDRERIDEIIEALCNLGFDYHEEKDADRSKHAKLEKDGVVLELHRKLCHDGEFFGYYDAPFEFMQSIDGVQYSFSPEQLYVYNLAHASEHFMKGVNTIRAICDAHIIKKTYADMNKTIVSQLLEKTGLSEFERGMNSIEKAVFGTKKADGELAVVLDYVVMNPVRADTALAELQREKVSGKASGIQKISVVFRRAFPSYELICRRYANAKKSRLLYPFYAVKRFIDANKRGRVKEQFDAIGRVSDDEIRTLDVVRKYVGL